jgi:hypothetical protein
MYLKSVGEKRTNLKKEKAVALMDTRFRLFHVADLVVFAGLKGGKTKGPSNPTPPLPNGQGRGGGGGGAKGGQTEPTAGVPTQITPATRGLSFFMRQKCQ